MMDWLSGATGWAISLVAAFLGGVAVSFLEPVQRVVARAGRRARYAKPVRVHAETRLEVIWAGSPMAWVSHEFYVPNEDALPPDGSLEQWQAWVKAHGGCDHGTTLLVLTFTSDTPVPVVLRPPIPQVTSTPITAGRYLQRPALGGADLTPQAFELDLQTASLTGDEFALTAPVSWVLEPGSGAQQIMVRAVAHGAELYSWTLRLPLIVDGQNMDLIVDDDGKPFRTAGFQAALRTSRLVYGQWEDI